MIPWQVFLSLIASRAFDVTSWSGNASFNPLGIVHEMFVLGGKGTTTGGPSVYSLGPPQEEQVWTRLRGSLNLFCT